MSVVDREAVLRQSQARADGSRAGSGETRGGLRHAPGGAGASGAVLAITVGMVIAFFAWKNQMPWPAWAHLELARGLSRQLPDVAQ